MKGIDWCEVVRNTRPVKEDESATETCAFCLASSWWKPLEKMKFPTNGSPDEIQKWLKRSDPGNDYHPIEHKPGCMWVKAQ